MKVNTPIAVIQEDGEAASAAPMTVNTTNGAARATIASLEPVAPLQQTAQTALDVTVPPEPELAATTEFESLTIREALRDAMAEEMRRDGDVFLMGEEVAEYQARTKSVRGCSMSSGHAA